ncbi:3'-5' exonuclease [Ruficoccus sp. ZRK36]|uniref:3'-5' exonuclease n=1 Tax=Ruficoccus sp. ZRK36 TaxID=2866311 RepID=UPI001C7355C4|nr:3'-5' exonuclease [Ruficoccus sp. ZRK36]QYY37130.1 UvrD-helicase domain-containing protein [Ruficoccus sp. ZRK36]
MNFLISSTFNDSLTKLTGEEQKAVKTTAFDLQMNPANPGMKFHRVDRAKDKNFWSVRVSGDIRLIVHKTGDSLLLCYTDHHDNAYHWAERRKLETHPKTGAAQIVEIRETVQEVFVPQYVEAAEPQPEFKKSALFATHSEDELLGYGVPPEWLADVKQADEDSLLALADHLPEEASEALLELATGGTPVVASSVTDEAATDPFEHPDARRRFRVMTNVEELEQALEYPWEKWTVFLHPTQREVVERDYSGPVRVSGTAGTGKTIVALHRAVYLARKHPDARVLLTTFSEALAQSLRVKLRRLLVSQPSLGERIDVEYMDAVGKRLYERNVGKLRLVDAETVCTLLKEEAERNGLEGYSLSFLNSEWEQIVDAWQLDSWEAYRDVKRLGRKSRLNEAKREQLWAVFSSVQQRLSDDSVLSKCGMFSQLAHQLGKSSRTPYDFTVVDEAQDISISQLRFLAALGSHRADALFFTGDLGQRIFQQPFSWSSLGINIRGRSKTLRVNYRTSHQIRAQADRLLDPEISDMDGNVEKRTDTISVFNGPAPALSTFDSQQDEIDAVASKLKEWVADGVFPHEIGIFVRSENEIPRALSAIETSGLMHQLLSDSFESRSGKVAVSTMHLAKGLEYRAVIVMACDDEVMPSQERIEAIGDTADLEDVYNTERYLLYVACTRARDYLMVTSVEPASEFLDDLLL